MKKRRFAPVLALILALSLPALPALAAEEAGDGFSVDKGIVTYYDGPGGDITFPEGVRDPGILFFGRTDITGITFPSTLQSISDFSFQDCTGLTHVTIPEGVTYIGRKAFSGCTSLTSVTLPASLTQLGEEAFAGCTALTEVTLLGQTSIGSGAFAGCTALEKVTLAADPSSISGTAFRDTPWQAGLGEFAVVGGTLLRYQGDAEQVTVPDGITTVGEEAFSGLTGLTSVTLPESVTRIGSGAFAGCTALSRIDLPQALAEIGPAAFDQTPWKSAQGDFLLQGGRLLAYLGQEQEVAVPEGVSAIGPYAFSHFSPITAVSLPETLREIGPHAFDSCGFLTEIDLPDGLTSIGAQAFFGCSSLTSVTLPDSVAELGAGAFLSCLGLTQVTLSQGLTEIPEQAFTSAYSLTEVTIPEGVSSIGRMAFFNCSALADVTALGTPEVAADAFMLTPWAGNLYDYGLLNGYLYSYQLLHGGGTEAVLPHLVTTIGTGAFNYCTNLTRVSVPDSVTAIRSNAFVDCYALTDVYLPASVADIGPDAFLRCPEVTLHVAPGSAAEAYARENSIPYLADQPQSTVYDPAAYPMEQRFSTKTRYETLQVYALRDQNGDLIPYFRLRDVASLLNGTTAQFEVEFDGSIRLTTGAPYTPGGSELAAPFDGEMPYRTRSAPLLVNGEAVELDAIVLTDQNGGDYTYYPILDLAQALGFPAGLSLDEVILTTQLLPDTGTLS